MQLEHQQRENDENAQRHLCSDGRTRVGTFLFCAGNLDLIIRRQVRANLVEPRVDLQSRNMAEAQGDVSIRGGIFENTGFRVGSATLIDPQTGHYFA